MKQRMDGLVILPIVKELKTATRIIVNDFKKEGFADIDIYDYILGLVKEA